MEPAKRLRGGTRAPTRQQTMALKVHEEPTDLSLGLARGNLVKNGRLPSSNNYAKRWIPNLVSMVDVKLGGVAYSQL